MQPTTYDTLWRIANEQAGFLTIAGDLAVLAADPETRLRAVLVRCGACRFTAPADQAAHLIAIITREGSDYVRDVSLPAGDPAYQRGGTR